MHSLFTVLSLCIFSAFNSFYYFCFSLSLTLRVYIFCLKYTEITTNKRITARTGYTYGLFSAISLAGKYAAITIAKTCAEKESNHATLYLIFRLLSVLTLVSIVCCVFLCLHIVYRLFASNAGIALRNFVQFLQFLP